jgi:hypothetical protein
MMSLRFRKILLEEAEESISTTCCICRLAGNCQNLGSCRFRRVICRELCGKVGGNERGDRRGWLSIRLYDSDMCIFGLCWFSWIDSD